MKKYYTAKYDICKSTMAVISNNVEEYQSLILEPGKLILCKQTPNQILRDSCLRSGSTIEGRREATKKILGTNKKLPLTVNPGEGIYLIPTEAVKSKGCAWISYNQIKLTSAKGNLTEITFKDGSTLIVDTSKKPFDQLMNRTERIIVYINRGILFDNDDE
ncbi:hypothetical protein GH741_14965 [Aquibacillus halophilus]|uniref:Competence protein n=1 Tax=Aquibacillus halophilus TaxID=930132 RepID=A0A6A8DRV2_9BACI|nr:competence protein ComK [Aquibacillus halophilus]MRH43942.1 hypothetical protein [Aquibacillus halophilus]